MKTALYIEDGDVQLVITPENEWEKSSLSSFGDSITATIWRGQFYACQGGWNRQRDENYESRSLIIRVKQRGGDKQ